MERYDAGDFLCGDRVMTDNPEGWSLDNGESDAHDRLVSKKINDLIYEANRRAKEPFMGHVNPVEAAKTIATKLKLLHTAAQNIREAGDTTNLIDRDVEYYFWGRWLVADGRSELDMLDTVFGSNTGEWAVAHERSLLEVLGIEAAGLVAAPLYEGAKGLGKAAYSIKDHFTGRHEADYVFSSDGKPTSAAGGIDWFYTGMADGESDPGWAKQTDVKYHFPPPGLLNPTR